MRVVAKRRFIIGIDEVGRGPLAGPVVVGVVALPVGFSIGRKGLRDSKKLTAVARAEWARYIEDHPKISYALARVGAKTVDKTNITKAANLAALRAFSRLTKTHGIKEGDCSIYLDGGLYLGRSFRDANGTRRSRLSAKTVIKGDETIPAIAMASIMAKVHRDRIMERSAKRFPGYGFETHKGYGTAAHRLAVRRLGPTEAHRLTFLGKWNTIDRKSKAHKSNGRRTNKTS
jgi:ribonuclease HII